MSIKLMYITNKTDVAITAERMGVDRIFVDMEYIGKSDRQGGMDTVQSHHTVEDVKKIRNVISKSDLLVRINPIHNSTNSYCSSEDEINSVINAGADIIMLPYFKSVSEVERFIHIVNGKAKTMLLLETPEAVDIVDEILKLDGIDEIFIGLNDLSLGYKKRFMFELLEDGTVEELCLKFRKKGIPYGFGGIASIGSGTLPAEAILKEHYRLGSSIVILSRSFCNSDKINNIEEIEHIFSTGVNLIRTFEKEISYHSKYFEDNKEFIKSCVSKIISSTNR